MKKQEDIKNRLREIIANKGQCGHDFMTGCSIPCAIKASDGNCIMRVPNAWDGKERTTAEWDARRYQTMHKIAVEALQEMLIRKKISPLDIVETRHTDLIDTKELWKNNEYRLDQEQ